MSRRLKAELPDINFKRDDIGKRIAKIRKEQGLTQKELADKIGIERYLLSDYELGRARIYDEMIIRLALVLSIGSDELLGLKKMDNPTSPSLKLMKRLYKIDKLPLSKQKYLLKKIDTYLNLIN